MTNSKADDKSLGKRKLILESAEKLFGKYGYHATEVEEIARSAGMAKGTIYNYFKSKENILLSVLEDGIQELSVKMAIGIEQIDDSVEKIKKGIQIYVQFFEEHLPLFRIFISEQIQFTMKEGKDFHKRIFSKLTYLEDVIAKAVDEDELNKIDPFVAASSLLGMINFTFNRGLVLGRKFSAARTTEQITKLFLEGMLP